MKLPFEDEREYLREDVRIEVKVRELGAVATTARVVNLSPQGCGLTHCDLSRGAELWLHLPSHDPVRATVIWAKGSRAGCQFYTLLTNPRRPAQPARRHLIGAIR